MYEVVKDRFHFNGIGKVPTVADATHGPWAKTVTAAGGSPTVKNTNGALELTMDDTDEVQNLCVNFGDELSYDIRDIIKVEFLARFSASFASQVSAAFGLSSARNDAIDSITELAAFRVHEDNAVHAETDDGTTDLDDKDTGLTALTEWQNFVIDFARGVKTNSGVASVGGRANIQFLMDNADRLLRRVCDNTVFDMSQYSGQLQPFFQIQKTSSTAVGSMYIKEICVHHRRVVAD